nr:retrotransposon Gag domain, retroviral aspartyl protease [Tanacetum cinerariifolium]
MVDYSSTDSSIYFVYSLALHQESILTYNGYETLPRGDSMNPYFLKALEGSRIHVIVFSENYANSLWCLDELAYIMKCVEYRGQIVVPIFYHVDLYELQKPSGRYAQELSSLDRYDDQEKVEVWRKALVDVSNLPGWELNNNPDSRESMCIKQVVDTILKKLSPNKYLSGIETRLQDLKLGGEAGNPHLPPYQIEEISPLDESTYPSHLEAIVKSQIAVIIFSKNYADSSTCLEELACIMNCVSKRGQIIIPIFHHMDPLDVRKQKGKYREALIQHELENKSKVNSWIEALYLSFGSIAGNRNMMQTRNSENNNPPDPIATQLGAIAAKLEVFETMKEDIAALKEGERFRSRSTRNGEGENSWRGRQPQRPYNKIDFSIFSSGDPHGWLMKAEKYFRYYQIPDEEKVEIASMHLEGDALDLYSWLSHDQIVIFWEELVQAFTRSFGLAEFHNPDEFLYSIKQTGSVHEYRQEFAKRSSRVSNWPDHCLLGVFLNGLKDELKSDV